ncbi:unnamed protein product, partial [Ectocarpus sp. 4 AP-2014]
SIPPQHTQQSRSPLSSGVPEPDPTGAAGAKMQASAEHLEAITAGGGVCVGRAAKAQTHPLSRSRERTR